MIGDWQRCIYSVLQEVSTIPYFMEPYSGFYEEFKRKNEKPQYAPLSSLSYYLLIDKDYFYRQVTKYGKNNYNHIRLANGLLPLIDSKTNFDIHLFEYMKNIGDKETISNLYDFYKNMYKLHLSRFLLEEEKQDDKEEENKQQENFSKILNQIENKNVDYKNMMIIYVGMIIEENNRLFGDINQRRRKLRKINLFEMNISPINYHYLQKELAFCNIFNYHLYMETILCDYLRNRGNVDLSNYKFINKLVDARKINLNGLYSDDNVKLYNIFNIISTTIYLQEVVREKLRKNIDYINYPILENYKIFNELTTLNQNQEELELLED